jgi:3-deoxy-D-manno-octulosonic-acid transferase
LWIADTLGELGLWYRLCSVVFVGRSLIPPGGGQNPTEPARLGCAIAVGPYTDNFSSHVALLKEAGALRVIDDVNALIQFASAMLSDPIQRRQMGESAKAAVRSSETLVNDTARTLLELMTHG